MDKIFFCKENKKLLKIIPLIFLIYALPIFTFYMIHDDSRIIDIQIGGRMQDIYNHYISLGRPINSLLIRLMGLLSTSLNRLWISRLIVFLIICLNSLLINKITNNILKDDGKYSFLFSISYFFLYVNFISVMRVLVSGTLLGLFFGLLSSYFISLKPKTSYFFLLFSLLAYPASSGAYFLSDTIEIISKKEIKFKKYFRHILYFCSACIVYFIYQNIFYFFIDYFNISGFGNPNDHTAFLLSTNLSGKIILLFDKIIPFSYGFLLYKSNFLAIFAVTLTVFIYLYSVKGNKKIERVLFIFTFFILCNSINLVAKEGLVTFRTLVASNLIVLGSSFAIATKIKKSFFYRLCSLLTIFIVIISTFNAYDVTISMNKLFKETEEIIKNNSSDKLNLYINCKEQDKLEKNGFTTRELRHAGLAKEFWREENRAVVIHSLGKKGSIIKSTNDYVEYLLNGNKTKAETNICRSTGLSLWSQADSNR